MKWKAFFLGTTIGVIGGYTLTERFLQKQNASPENILHEVKNQFKKQGPIQGSWIITTPESYDKGPLRYQIFKGGISRERNEIIEQFEFIADAKTGSIIDIHPLSI
ncbi:MAG: hypothetical protein Q8934_14940 [Bacillota bacterium]|nr:hypothetical protein [Bacillota bacterium]